MKRQGNTARARYAYGAVLLLMAMTLACQVDLAPTATPTLAPTATPVPTATPTPEPQPQDTGWQAVADGIEVRELDVALEEWIERVTIARLDPARVRFSVQYTPGAATSLGAWGYQTGAALTVNAGYFTEEYLVTGLTITHGAQYGVIYGDYAGMFAVTPDDAVSVRWLRQQPYDAGETLREAVQCFPVLIKPGGVMGFPAEADDGRVARRTVVAQDTRGNILFLVASKGYFSLHALAVWLAQSGLAIDTAVNLDGGPSSGLWMPNGPKIDSLSSIPAVITVQQR